MPHGWGMQLLLPTSPPGTCQQLPPGSGVGHQSRVLLPEPEKLQLVPSAGAAQGNGGCWPGWGAGLQEGTGGTGSPGPACPGTALPLPLPPPLQDEAMKLFFYLSSFQFRLRKICAPLATLQ